MSNVAESTIIDDSELPGVPRETEAAAGPPVEATFDGDLLDTVPGMGEAIPIGTYHFRLDAFTEGWTEPAKDPKTQLVKDPDAAKFGKQPYFLLNWICQQEPHTGRRVSEFCSYCTQAVFDAAKAGDKTAKKLVENRMYVVKDVLNGCDLKAVGNMSFKSFLASNPECKLQLKYQQGKSKDSTGKYVPDGTQTNGVVKHISIRRPA